MISRIAWRNMLRNKRRSLILITSIVIGVVAMMITDEFTLGMMRQMLTNQIGADAGYIQIHMRGYQRDPVLKKSITNPDELGSLLAGLKSTANFAERLRTFGLISSAYNSSGVTISGVDPASEKNITTIPQYIVKGTYLTGDPGQVLVASSIADKLKVGLGDKIVLMASRVDGSVGSEACRVAGIYETFDSDFDQTHVYVNLQTAEQMLGLHGWISQIVINPDNPDRTDAIAEKLQKEIPDGYELLTYKKMLPLLVMQINLYGETIYIFYAIIGIALIFGIVNTMLMSVMERTHEFGVEMAVGMSGKRIFTMILTEAFYLGAVGTFIGVIISATIYVSFAHSGWNLASFSDSLKSFGLGTTVYPVFSLSSLINTIIIIPSSAVAGSIYPALRAVRLQPVEAIRAT